MPLAGVLPVLLIGGTLLLWQQGSATAGDIAAAGAIAMRIAQMSGWVSFTLMSIYTSVGEVEDGMRTLSVPHTLTDAPDAADPAARARARSALTMSPSPMVAQRGGVGDINLTIRAGRKAGHRRRLGRGEILARFAAFAAL